MEVMEYWKINNSCDDYMLAVPGILPGTSSWTETYLFDNCLNGTQNIHLYVQGAGHIWPGSIYSRINDPDSGQRIWDFFSKYDINGVIQ
jgi:polyhydroxybutyrate depolymerase